MDIRPEDMGTARRYVDVAARGEMVSVISAEGRPIAHMIPATEAVTTALIAELSAAGVSDAFLEILQNVQGDPAFRYRRATNQVVAYAPIPGPTAGGDQGGAQLLEDEFAVKLLTLLCLEIDSTVPTEHVAPRARQLLRQAKEVSAHLCGYSSWDALSEDINKNEQAVDKRLRQARRKEDKG